MTTPILIPGNYKLNWHCEFKNEAEGVNAGVRVRILELSLVAAETYASIGAGLDNNPSPLWSSFSGPVGVTITISQAYTVVLEYNTSSTGTDHTHIRNAYIEFFRVS